MIVPHITQVLEALGFKVWLDLDGDLQYEAPADVTRDQVISLLRKHIEAIEWDLRWRAKRAARVFVGGPMNGRSHTKFGPDVIAVNLTRGKWAAYRVTMDGRAFYAGEATNRRLARRLAYSFRPPVGNPEQEDWTL